MLPVEVQQLTYINPLAVRLIKYCDVNRALVILDDSTTSVVNLDIESVRRSLDNALMGIDYEGRLGP
jgi:hypothetical protein